MGLLSKNLARGGPSYLFPCVLALSFFSAIALLLYKVDDFISQTKTVAGYNLEPTPWHLFPTKNFNEEPRQARAYKIIQCSYLTCRYSANTIPNEKRFSASSKSNQKCPDFFRAIHRDLHPWIKTKISRAHLEETNLEHQIQMKK